MGKFAENETVKKCGGFHENHVLYIKKTMKIEKPPQKFTTSRKQ